MKAIYLRKITIIETDWKQMNGFFFKGQNFGQLLICLLVDKLIPQNKKMQYEYC